jgi:hypothetical protein
MKLDTHYQLSGWVRHKYSLSSPSSLLVVKLISVERMDSVFLFLLLAVFSGFNCILSALISSKRKAKDFFTGPVQLWLQSEPFSVD